MATTTTSVNACDADIRLDNADGDPINVSGSTNSVVMNFDHQIGDFRVFQDKWPVRLACGKDAAFTLNVVYDSTAATTAFGLLRDWFFTATPGLRTLAIYIPDKEAGSDYYYGEMHIANLNWTADPSEPGAIAVTAELLPSGEVTLDTAGT